MASSLRCLSRAARLRTYSTCTIPTKTISCPCHHPHNSYWRYLPGRFFSSSTPDTTTTSTTAAADSSNQDDHSIRLSKLLSQHTQKLAISRREAERLIQAGEVTVAGRVITSPHYLLRWKDLTKSSAGLVRVSGKAVVISQPDNSDANRRRVWLVHKLRGEVVAESDDPRPSLMERLKQSGLGKNGKHVQQHLKPIGRLDMSTEGLILVTTCGKYAREMELPSNQIHRTYRVRVHGFLTRHKVEAIQRGIRIDNPEKNGQVTRYSSMKVHLQAPPRGRSRSQHQQRSTNTWITITCTEGKNRQIRNVMQHLGLTVTRLIRTSFGDYNLDKIPPGLAIEVPLKEIDTQKRRGPLFPQKRRNQSTTNKTKDVEEIAPPVTWVRHYR